VAHIHLPDGSFTLTWVLIYFTIAAIMIILVVLWMKIKKIKLTTEQKAMAGILAALMFVITQIPIPAPWGGTHLNFTSLLGIMAGPFIALIVDIVVNIFSALIGHGGWTILGANIILYYTESFSGWFIYKFLRRNKIEENKMSRFAAATIATAISLTFGTFLLTIMIGIAGINGVAEPGLDLISKLWLLNAINLIVGAIEAILTGYIIEFIGKIRPDYISADIEGSIKGGDK
jgi:cobalt/nickel transport system permease protein